MILIILAVRKRLISHIDLDLSSLFYCFLSNSFEQQLKGLLTPLLCIVNPGDVKLQKNL